jgi:hypothetical protein
MAKVTACARDAIDSRTDEQTDDLLHDLCCAAWPTEVGQRS